MLRGRIRTRMRDVLASREGSLGALAAGLDAMSPLKVLGRGYAIATTREGRAVRSPEDVSVGDTLELRVARGRLDAEVVALHEDPAAPVAPRGGRPLK